MIRQLEQLPQHGQSALPVRPSTLCVCFDRALPDEAVAVAVLRGDRSRPPTHSIDPPTQSRGAMLGEKMWTPVGRTLRIRFLDGHPAVQQKVARFAQEWSQYANLHFAFEEDNSLNSSGKDPVAEIRVSFAQPGSWSYIGTDALHVPSPEPTMNFGWLTPGTPNDEVQRVVLHEFGHALGLIHEHQHPGSTIPWNREAVYDYYSGPPNCWSRAQVELNLFQRYAVAHTQYSAFDESSIMLYPVPQEFTNGHFAVGWNQTLSPIDKAFVASCYPYPINYQIGRL